MRFDRFGENMRDIANYEEEYNKEYCENIQVEFRFKKIIEIINRYNHNCILEVGCGNIPFFMRYQDFEELTIVEPGKSFANNARKLSNNFDNKKICIYEAFIEDIQNKLESNKYDYILLSSLIHELDNPINVLSTIYNLCSNDTIVHINVPNAYSIHRILAKELGMISDVHEISSLGKKLQQNKVYDLEQLSSLVESIGFEVIEKGSYFPKFFSYSQIEQMLRYDIIDDKYFEGMYKLSDSLPNFGSEIYLQIRKA